jgi:hypothetical protein
MPLRAETPDPRRRCRRTRPPDTGSVFILGEGSLLELLLKISYLLFVIRTRRVCAEFVPSWDIVLEIVEILTGLDGEHIRVLSHASPDNEAKINIVMRGKIFNCTRKMAWKAGHPMPDARCPMLDARCSMLDVLLRDACVCLQRKSLAYFRALNDIDVPRAFSGFQRNLCHYRINYINRPNFLNNLAQIATKLHIQLFFLFQLMIDTAELHHIVQFEKNIFIPTFHSRLPFRFTCKSPAALCNWAV